MKTNRKRAGKVDWRKADARVLGQILAAQNIEFVLPDTTHLAEFYAEILVAIPGVAACRICLEDVSIQKGKIDREICTECQASRKKATETKELLAYGPGFKCRLTNQPGIEFNVVNSLHHHFGFFIFQISSPDVFHIYKPFIGNLANYVAMSLENRLQRNLLQSSREELEHRVDERTQDLLAANLHLQKEIETRVQAEEALRESERQVKHLIDSSPVAMVVSSGAEEHVEWINDKFIELFGYTIEDMPNAAHWWPLAYPDEKYRKTIQAQWQTNIEQAAGDGRQSQPIEAMVRCKDGSLRYVEFRFSAVGPKHLITLTDLTERKQAEDALRESEERYKLLLNSATDYIYTVQIQNGYPVSTTHGPGCMAVTGYMPEDYRADAGLWYRMIYEPDRTAVMEQVAGILAGETITVLEHRIIHRDGSMRWVRNTPVPHYNQQQQLIAYDGLISDITKRKQAEEALRESEEMFRGFFQQSTDGIAVVDEQARLAEWNQTLEVITGLKREYVIGRLMADVQMEMMLPERRSPEILERIRTALREMTQTGQSPAFKKTTDASIHRPDGTRRIIQQNSFPIPTEHGYRIGIITRDVTESRRSEEALRESETKFRAVFESSVDAIGVSKAGIHTFVNPAYLALFGYTDNAELNGKPILDLIAPSHRGQILENVRRRVSGQIAPTVYETRGLRKDGSEFDMDVHMSTYELNGETYSVPIIRDITERKRAEDALVLVAQRGWQTSGENFFDALAQFLGEKLTMDYVLIDRIDENPDIAETVALYAKGAITPNMHYALKGTPCENVMGRRLCVYPHGVQQLFPEDPLLPEMGAESYIGIPLWDSTGQPIGLIAVMSNKPLPDDAPVTQLLQLVATRAAAELEREQSDRLLRKREQEFRTLAENSPDVIVRYDRKGHHIYVNPEFERVNHISAQEVQGKTPIEFSTELAPKGDVFMEKLMAVMESGTADKIDLSWTKDGQPICWFVRLMPEFDADGKVVSALTIWSDISERKRAEEKIFKLNQDLEQRVFDRTAELEAANKELEAFAYSVSHDLRAPLRHIDGFLELLQKRTATILDEKSQHYMATISDSAKRMGMLIDDLLSFSRMGRNEISKSQVDLGELVQDVIREFRPEAEERDIHWKISPLPLVIGDRAMLQIVLSNLISNALKFTRSRSQAEIEISWMPGHETETIVFVRDNGVGFDMQYADKLFGVFQRLHRADEFEGTGIGLANVRRVINRHGGKTWAEGEVDHGATFYFSLPQTHPGR